MNEAEKLLSLFSYTSSTWHLKSSHYQRAMLYFVFLIVVLYWG